MIDFTAVKNLVTKFTVTGAQKAHIDRLVFELAILEKQIATLEQKCIEKDILLNKLQTVLSDREAENKELLNKLNSLLHFREEFDDVTNAVVIKMIGGRGFTMEAISQQLEIDFGIIEYIFDLLLKENFVLETKPEIIMFGERSPAEFKLTASGRNYAAKMK